MNDILKIELSEASLFLVIVLGIVISLIFGLARKTVIQKLADNRVKQIYLALEIFVWLIYALWALKIVLGETFYYMLAVLSTTGIVFLWLGWFMVRDFIAGLVLKFSDNFQPGQLFQLGEIKGTIIHADYVQLRVEQNDGTIIKIPYNKISGNIHYKAEAQDSFTQHRFELQVNGKFTFEELKEKVRQAILFSPGVSINKEPQIEIKETLKEGYKLDVVTYAMHSDYYSQIEQNVLKQSAKGFKD